MPRSRSPKIIERYELDRSPFSQRPTKRDLVPLLGESLKDLTTLSIPAFKEQFVVRRQTRTGRNQKLRDLVYPEGRLRGIHERLKFHLNKVKQPSYLFSPRANRSQRDNAALHLDQDQYLILDLKQFYPSTSSLMVQSWLEEELGMYSDVASLITNLSTIDGKVSFGSPLTPVLCTLVHRKLFDRIADLCEVNSMQYSLWVDDLTISGKAVTGKFLNEVRKIITEFGLKSHKIKFLTGNRPVFITGIGVVGRKLIGTHAMNLKIAGLWKDYHETTEITDRDKCVQRLLSALGGQRHIVGPETKAGMKIADEMNSLRQKKAKMYRQEVERQIARRAEESVISTAAAEMEDAPF
ncbi:reverse transcriptase family protein [Corticibacterium sp. UT-5YL-CI-8]|nr:reverse transcriptase family protein [Tianweitania sp. UT-5YL-CI-8]